MRQLGSDLNAEEKREKKNQLLELKKTNLAKKSIFNRDNPRYSNIHLDHLNEEMKQNLKASISVDMVEDDEEDEVSSEDNLAMERYNQERKGANYL